MANDAGKPVSAWSNWTLVHNVNTGGPTKRNALAAGLSSGLDDMAGLGYSAVGAVADTVGAKGVRDWANEQADRNQYLSQVNGRPDLERIEDQTPGTILPWLGYQAAKQVPNVAGAIAAGLLVPEAAVPAWMARAAAVGPRSLGMGGEAARVAAAVAEGGSVTAAREAARGAGLTFGKQVVGGSAFNYGQSVGSLYQESVDGGDPDSGIKSLIGGVPYALAETLPEAMLVGRIGHGSGFRGNMAARVGKAALSQGATGATSELLQNEMEMAYNGHVTDADAFSKRLNSGAAGFAVEALMGGLGGVRKHSPARATLEQQGTADLLNPQRGLVLTPQQAPLQQYIDQAQGITAPTTSAQDAAREKAYQAQFEAAAAEPTGSYTTDPATGIESPDTALNAVQRQAGLLMPPQEQQAPQGDQATVPASDPALTPTPATQTPQEVQSVLQAHQQAQDQREQAAQPTPEQQAAQARIDQIKQAATEAAQAVQARNQRASQFGITKPAVLSVYGELERAHTDTLVDDKEFGAMAGQLSAGDTNAVRKDLVDRRKEATAKAEQVAAVKQSDEDQVRDVFAKVQKPAAPKAPEAPVSPATASAPSAASQALVRQPAATVAGIKAGKQVTVGRTGREQTLTPGELLAKIVAAPALDKMRIMAVTGMDVTKDATTGSPRLVSVGNPMTFEQVAAEEAKQTGRKVTRQAISHALKKYGINEDVATRMTAQDTPAAVSNDELGISLENSGSGFRVESELSKATGQGLVDDGNTQTKAQRETSAQADELLKAAGPSTAVATTPKAEPGQVVTDLRAQNPAKVEHNIRTALDSSEAVPAKADWEGATPWDHLSDSIKADFIEQHAELSSRLDNEDGYTSRHFARDLDQVQEQTERDHHEREANLKNLDAPTAAIAGVPAANAGKIESDGQTDGQVVTDSAGQAGGGTTGATSTTSAVDPSTGTGAYNGDTGQRTGTAAQPVVTTKKKWTVAAPQLNNLERLGDNSAPVVDAKRSPSLVRRLRGLLKELGSNNGLSDAAFINRVEMALAAKDRSEDAKLSSPRVRGADYVRQRLLEAKRRGDLSEDGVNLAEWFIQKNPALLDDLGVTIQGSGKNGDSGISGQYDSITRVIRLIKESSNSDTTVHEILHHLERMMPAEVQQGLRAAWGRQLATALVEARKGSDENLKAYYEALAQHHFEGGNQAALAKATELLKSGKVGYDHYALFNPSEFWAVHGSRILEGRFNVSTSVLGKLRVWLGELGQKLKSLLGMNSDAAVLKALSAMARSDGTYTTGQMLGEGQSFNNLERGSAGATERTTERMPEQARQTQTVVTGVIKNAITQGKLWLAQTNDLARMATRIIPSVEQYMKLLDSSTVARTRAEVHIDNVLKMYDALPKHEQGVGPSSANIFLRDSTSDKVWGYKPEYHAKAVVDPAMAARFNALSPAAQAMVKAVFLHGHENLQRMKTAVMENIHTDYDALIAEAVKAGDAGTAAREQAAKVKALADYASLNALSGDWPYAPLKRFGNHVVVGMSREYLQAEKAGDAALVRKLKSKPEHYNVSFAETKGERTALAAQLQLDQPQFQQGDGGLTQDFNKDDAGDQLYAGKDMLGMFRRLRTLVNDTEDKHLSGKSAAALKGLMTDLHLLLLSESSARQSERQRLTVAGSNDDMMRAFSTQGRATAHFIANLQNSGKVYEALSAMKGETDARVEEPGNTRGERREYYNELLKRHAMNMDYNPSPFVNKALGLSSFWHLAVSPAYYLTNATQPFVMSLPVMAGKHGYGRSSVALLRAYRDMMPLLKKGKLTEADYQTLPADVRMGVQMLVDQGKIDISLEQDLGRWRSEDSSKLKHVGTVVDKMREISQALESVNRLTTAIAALRLESSKGVNLSNQVTYAAKLIDDTHGNYSGANAPRIMRTPTGRLLTQFRKFQLIQVSLFTRLIHQSFKGASAEERYVAQKALAFSLGTMFTLGGALGMPGAQVVGFILRHSLGDGDEPDNSELTLRKLIGDETLADLLTLGVPKMLGVNLSGRVGAGGMLSLAPYANLDMSKKGAEGLIVQAAGPFVGGMLPKFAQGLGLISQGNYWKGLEQLLPTGMDNVSKAVRMQSHGLTQPNGDVVMKPEDISFLDATMQALGLPTNTLTDRSFHASAAFESDKFFHEKSNQIKTSYTAAHRSGDGPGAAEARQQWAELQVARKSNGYTAQPLSELMKAPQAQLKRERNVIGGVEFRKDNKGARQMVDNVS